jgi:hypothetical protein
MSGEAKKAYMIEYRKRNREKLNKAQQRYRSDEYDEELQESIKLEIANRDKLAQSVKNLEDFYYTQ